MSHAALARRIQGLGFTLLQLEQALDARPHVLRQIGTDRHLIEWARSGSYVVPGCPPSVNDYRVLVSAAEYSYLMRDGALIQVSYSFNCGVVEAHRLNFHPCPFQFDPQEPATHGGVLLDYPEDAFSGNLEANIVFRSPLRFDYAPQAAGDGHPASHLTVNDSRCRIPARAPLFFDTFIKFVFENFYPDLWSEPKVKDHLQFAHEAECMSADDGRRVYLSWSHPR